MRKLSAGQYLIRISPKAGNRETVTAKFSEDDLKIVDQDLDPAAGAAVPVSPAASSSAGTITVRKVPFYRARFSRGHRLRAQRELDVLSDSEDATLHR